MRSAQPDSLEAGREVSPGQRRLFEPRKPGPEQAVVLNRDINGRLHPRRVPGTKKTRLRAATKETRAPFHGEFSGRPSGAELEGDARIDRCVVGETMLSGIGRYPPTQFGGFKAMFVFQGRE